MRLALPVSASRRIRPTGRFGVRGGLGLIAALVVPLVGALVWAQPAPPAGERLIDGVGFLARDAARPSWSTQGDWIAYDKPGGDGYSDLHIARPDGSYDRCLTCDEPTFHRQHAGNADWHPSGDYLVFQAERPFPGDDGPLPFLAIPGRSRESSLWVVSLGGRDFFQLAGHQPSAYPVHTARFSFEGDRLAWSERLASGGTWGDWVIRAGELRLGRGVVRVANVVTYEPAAQKAFYEVCSFTPDDRGLLVAGNFVDGQPIDGLDLYILDLESKQVRQLTKSLTVWDRWAAFAPASEVIAWSSGEALRRPPRPLARTDRTAVVRLDLWVGAVDGSWSRRLTGFNDPLADEYVGAVMVGPSAFAPRGDRLLTTLTPLDDPGHSDLFVVTLSRPVGTGGMLSTEDG